MLLFHCKLFIEFHPITNFYIGGSVRWNQLFIKMDKILNQTPRKLNESISPSSVGFYDRHKFIISDAQSHVIAAKAVRLTFKLSWIMLSPFWIIYQNNLIYI